MIRRLIAVVLGLCLFACVAALTTAAGAMLLWAADQGGWTRVVVGAVVMGAGLAVFVVLAELEHRDHVRRSEALELRRRTMP